MNERGIVLLELALAGVLLGLIFGAVASAVSTDPNTTRVLLSPIGPELRAQAVLERLASELRMAGEWGEDTDQDGVLDDGEDSNGNGVLDADWSLANGAVDQTNLSFNRRIDEYDADGNLVATGIYSRRVTYRLEADRLIREWQRTDGGGGTENLRVVLAHDIAEVRFSRTGRLVTLELDVAIPENVYAPGRRTVATQVWLRN